MDPFRWQDYYRNYKSATSQGQYKRNYNDSRQKRELFKASRNQKSPYKKKNNFAFRKNFKAQQKKNAVDAAKSVSAEDAEEEERKKKLSDAANKLLSKIKTWSAENNNISASNTNMIITEESVESTSSKNSDLPENEGKPRRIAHSKSTDKQVKKVPRNATQSAKNLTNSKYKVNKATVKDFQNRIQHKLINEIMQMPKENLQNVLNDPKINPILELKMSHLVKENKLLIAQKLRTLAESKMTSNDSATHKQLLVDIDKLIDPVIETDLSVLPYELIKQMENIFQVQFDYSNCSEPQTASHFITNSICCDNDSICNVKAERHVSEDLTVYECSTDEDEEVGEVRVSTCESNYMEISPKVEMPVETMKRTLEDSDGSNKRRKCTSEDNSTEQVLSSPNQAFSVRVRNLEEDHSPAAPETQPEPEKELISRYSQTDTNSKHVATQTVSESNLLYGVPVPKTSKDNSSASLLEEVNSIQNLINKLNERRFKIFLDLAKTNPSGSFVSDKFVCDNFIESVSNGNSCLVESLTKFFTQNKQNVGYKQKKSKFSRNKRKSWTKKGNQNPPQLS